MWLFWNNEGTFITNKFRSKFSFNPRNKDAIIEIYLSCLEERLLDMEIPYKRYNSHATDERDTLYNLNDDLSIFIKVLLLLLLLLSGIEAITWRKHINKLMIGKKFQMAQIS